MKEEYERMTGEAVADSKGDSAAAKCFLKKTNEKRTRQTFERKWKPTS